MLESIGQFKAFSASKSIRWLFCVPSFQYFVNKTQNTAPRTMIKTTKPRIQWGFWQVLNELFWLLLFFKSGFLLPFANLRCSITFSFRVYSFICSSNMGEFGTPSSDGSVLLTLVFFLRPCSCLNDSNLAVFHLSFLSRRYDSISYLRSDNFCFLYDSSQIQSTIEFFFTYGDSNCCSPAAGYLIADCLS